MRVNYETQILGSGSGDPILLRGRAFLHVTLRLADTQDDFGNPTLPSSAPDIRDLAAVREISAPDVFEAVASWGVGAAARTPFQVRSFDAPSRIAIDISHTPPGTGNQLLQVGASGAAVATWQWRLRLALQRSLAVDEVFGPLTQAATREFQDTRGLVTDGIVGPATRAQMQNVLGV